MLWPSSQHQNTLIIHEHTSTRHSFLPLTASSGAERLERMDARVGWVGVADRGSRADDPRAFVWRDQLMPDGARSCQSHRTGVSIRTNAHCRAHFLSSQQSLRWLHGTGWLHATTHRGLPIHNRDIPHPPSPTCTAPTHPHYARTHTHAPVECRIVSPRVLDPCRATASTRLDAGVPQLDPAGGTAL